MATYSSDRRSLLKIIGAIGATCAYPFAGDELFGQTLAPHEAGSLANAKSRAAPSPKAAAAEPASQSTLTPADLAPTWRGPASRKDGKHSA